MIECKLVPEPLLLVGGNRTSLDPKVGILNFGPSGLDVRAGESKKIRTGAVGTFASLAQLNTFVGSIGRVVRTEDDGEQRAWKVDFPGIGTRGPLGFDLVIDRSCVETISEREEEYCITKPTRKARIEAAIQLYEQKIQDLAMTAHPPPELVLFPLSTKLLDAGRDPAHLQNKIIYQPRSRATDAGGSEDVFDFHHVLKVLSFQYGLACQVLRPDTMALTADQDPATIAWNLAMAIYYKATGTPWKLAELDDRTCFVGISFYEEPSKYGVAMRASMAHVYVRTGESQIIRGRPFQSSPDPTRQTTLDAGLAEELLHEVVSLFTRQRGVVPRRVVVHKSSPFVPSEIEGFNRAAKQVSQVDYVHVDTGAGVRFFHADSGYPPLRGTLLTSSGSPRAFLYAAGFVPALGTYPGSNAPFPIVLTPARLDTSIEQVAADILALTRLDWNSCDFSVKIPVTISVSRKVGHILIEMRGRALSPPQGYRYYM